MKERPTQAAGEAETSQFPFFIGGLLVALAGVAALAFGPQTCQCRSQRFPTYTTSLGALWFKKSGPSRPQASAP